MAELDLTARAARFRGMLKKAIFPPARQALAAAVLAGLVAASPLAAQQTAPGGATPRTTAPSNPAGNVSRLPAPVEAGQGALYLTAVYAASDTQPIRSGVVWRVFSDRADAAGAYPLIIESKESAPALALPEGDYIVHAAFGLSGATRRITLRGQGLAERLVLNAGGLRITGMLGETAIDPAKQTISIFVPERGNSEAKLVLTNGRPGDVFSLPEGAYHIVSTLLDTVGVGATNAGAGAAPPTNSIVTADLRVAPGKLTDATLRHRAATMTMKLVSQRGGEALANTSFSVLTPGGDVIRELIGAFPSLVLAEGEYVVIARHGGKTFQTVFKVQSTLDRDVEVIAE